MKEMKKVDRNLKDAISSCMLFEGMTEDEIAALLDPAASAEPVLYERSIIMRLKTPRESLVEMTELVLPNDTNMLGNLLGGRLMHLVDVAGAMAAQRHSNRIVVTAAIDSVEFRRPVKQGQIVLLRAKVTWVGRTSMEVAVEVFSEDFRTGDRKFTNKAYLTFVAVDDEGKPVEVCGLLPETEEEKREYEAAEARRRERLKNRGK